MAKLTPAVVEYLGTVVQRAAQAGHGGKGEVYASACAFLGITLPTLHRWLAQVAVRPRRKRRSDRGCHTLTRDEAEQLSAYMYPHFRGNGKQGVSVRTAVETLRKNGLIKAERVEPETGEIKPLSTSSIIAALRQYGLHPEQLRRAPAAVPQASLHPNHTWQLDASTCVLFYLDDDGTTEMPEAVFYKNKLENFQKVARQRVTRFVITDHTSGAIKVRYFLGGESQQNFSEFFLWAMQKQSGHTDPMHGVPFALMVDPGSGLAGAFKNLARRLNINLIVNAPGNPRAKGQVENAQNLVEQEFEQQFRAQPPRNLADLNRRAHEWSTHYNGEATHGRTQMTRFAKWMEITQEQLRVLPSMEVCRQLMTADVRRCKVNEFNRVKFGGAGRTWDVSSVPSVQPGEWLDVTWNAYNDQEVFVVFHDADGREVLHPCPLVHKDVHGFEVGARVIGDGYQALPDSAADTARKRARMLATGTNTLQAAEKAEKKKTELMAGKVRFDYLAQENAARPVYMPKKASELVLGTQAPAQAMPERILNHFEVAKELLARGVQMSAEKNALVRQWYRDGVPEAELDGLVQRLAARSNLRLVAAGGGV